MAICCWLLLMRSTSSRSQQQQLLEQGERTWMACRLYHVLNLVSTYFSNAGITCYDLFDTLIRNRQIAGDFGNIACDFGEDHLGWYYDLFDTLLRNPQIAGDFGNIACDFVEDHNELFKSQVISIFKSQVISILARVRMWFRC